MSDLLRVLASSVRIADRAGQIVRDIMAKGQLGRLYQSDGMNSSLNLPVHSTLAARFLYIAL